MIYHSAINQYIVNTSTSTSIMHNNDIHNAMNQCKNMAIVDYGPPCGCSCVIVWRRSGQAEPIYLGGVGKCQLLTSMCACKKTDIVIDIILYEC